jgi:two-component system CheB/CheR fusion protein
MSNAQPRPLRILLVDDHEDSAHAMAHLLRHAGHVVTTAHTLAGALVLGTAGAAPDLLLCDIGLPDGDGCELLRRLRAFYGGRELPAVAVTGHGDEWVERCRDAGYGRFLVKPVAFGELLEAVAAATRLPGAATLGEVLGPHVNV